VSLSQYRGKAVILAFVDAECQTICPLTTQAMLDAKQDLGSAGGRLQLLGVNANWKSTQIDDVLNYTELHGMVGRWRFATGGATALEHVWKAYGVDEKALVTKADNEIDHVAALYVIDPQGRERVVFTTYPSYASVPQFGQLLARDVSRLLPSHPAVSTHYSYAEAPSTPPRRRVQLPKLGGGSLTLGPGKPHLYLFFATWDQQTLALADDLDGLNAYVTAAKRDGLPQLAAIDEGSVEPSAQAMPELIAKLPRRLRYPVATDGSGRVADGYHVQGAPWFVETNAAGHIVWFQEVYTEGWPPLARLEQELKAALHKQRPISQAKALAGSPAPLATLHRQGSKLLGGGQQALDARIRQLESDGYPVVLNIWSSWCGPCQAEFGLLAKASAEYGKRVAFLGADNADSVANAQAFLNGHHVSYPSYATSDDSIDHVLVGGLEGTPTTVFLVKGLKPVYVWSDPYESLGALQADISTYVLGRH
jgi:cytochrome oxidase Cu insertion factor (SCO1/SenC/PrrC family)/thiol-disulfide isomerase/thioredoxin